MKPPGRVDTEPFPPTMRADWLISLKAEQIIELQAVSMLCQKEASF
jgi:hypothetical protein